MKEVIEKLIAGQHLSEAEMEDSFEAIMSGQANDVQIGVFLAALRAKGETPSEIESAARVMRRKAIHVEILCEPLVDTCGTGGDGASTFNISTAVAFVLAGAGYKVAKHGNRSVSSSSGSADCLEALGVPIDMGPEEASRAIRKKGFCFLFAPAYHPSMKNAMPARRQLGIRTIFNALGPLANPAGATHQVVGVYSPLLVAPIIEVLKNMGLKGAMVVHGGLDEVSISGPTRYARLSDGKITKGEITPQEAGFPTMPMDELRVSSPKESAQKIEALFEGRLEGACLTSLLMNSAAAFMAIDGFMDLKAGVFLAHKVIRDGEALGALNRVRG
jgi:anthranilate phosphoribosyltransferase